MSNLIDADELIDGYRHMGYDPTEFEEESYQEGWCKGFNAAVQHCISHVIYAHTAEPQRIKGRWVRIESDTSCRYVCSLCGKTPLYNPYSDEVLTPFCPWCGADMRQGEQ